MIYILFMIFYSISLELKKGKFAQWPRTKDLRRTNIELQNIIVYNCWTEIQGILVLQLISSLNQAISKLSNLQQDRKLRVVQLYGHKLITYTFTSYILAKLCKPTRKNTKTRKRICLKVPDQFTLNFQVQNCGPSI